MLVGSEVTVNTVEQILKRLCVCNVTVSSPADFDPVTWNSGQQRVLHLNQKLRAEEEEEEEEEEDFDK